MTRSRICVQGKLGLERHNICASGIVCKLRKAFFLGHFVDRQKLLPELQTNKTRIRSMTSTRIRRPMQQLDHVSVWRVSMIWGQEVLIKD